MQQVSISINCTGFNSRSDGTADEIGDGTCLVRLFQITDCMVKFKRLKTKRLVCFDIFVFDFELDAYPDAYLKLVYN